MYNSAPPMASSQQRVVSGQAYLNAFWDREKASVVTNGGCQSGATVSAAQYQPWSPSVANPHSGVVMDSSFPNSEAQQSLYVRGKYDNGGGPMSPQQPQGCALSVDSLMPSSWRGGNQIQSMQGGCGGNMQAEQMSWSRYSPSKTAYNNAVTAAGSARLSIIDRPSLSKVIGIPNLLRPAPAVPVSSQAILFNDSDHRQNAYYQATGAYPVLSDCS